MHVDTIMIQTHLYLIQTYKKNVLGLYHVDKWY